MAKEMFGSAICTKKVQKIGKGYNLQSSNHTLHIVRKRESIRLLAEET
jgi:hypothetical protein